jgi:hypothetical protein
LWPASNLKRLQVPGGIVVAALVLAILYYADRRGKDTLGPVWPAVVAGAAFHYLWWLATVLFDLTFIWHRYIKHSVAMTQLRRFERQAAAASPAAAAATKRG